MYRRLFSLIKGKIPKISDTELIALRSGNTSLDRSILEGKVIFPQKHIYKKNFLKRNLLTYLKSLIIKLFTQMIIITNGLII